jgi:N-acetylglutamate synthase-like GNAT family acetyltransferase
MVTPASAAESDISYAPATPASILKVEELFRSFDLPAAFFGLNRDDPLSWEIARSSADDHIEGYLVARLGTETVGGGGVEVYDDSAILRAVVVHRLVQGHGIGSGIVGRLLNEATSRGSREVYVFARGDTLFWRRLGFSGRALPSWSAAVKRSWQYQIVACFEAEYLERGVTPMWKSLTSD